jgi:ankyrin repeat protein
VAAAPTPEENERVTYAAAAAAIELGADVNATNQAGETSLHVADAQAVDSVARLLVEKGANIEATNKRGLTPLGVAIAPRPRNPLQIDGPDRRASTAATLRKLGAKEPDLALLKPQAPQMPGLASQANSRARASPLRRASRHRRSSGRSSRGNSGKTRHEDPKERATKARKLEKREHLSSRLRVFGFS